MRGQEGGELEGRPCLRGIGNPMASRSSTARRVGPLGVRATAPCPFPSPPRFHDARVPIGEPGWKREPPRAVLADVGCRRNRNVGEADSASRAGNGKRTTNQGRFDGNQSDLPIDAPIPFRLDDLKRNDSNQSTSVRFSRMTGAGPNPLLKVVENRPVAENERGILPANRCQIKSLPAQSQD